MRWCSCLSSPTSSTSRYCRIPARWARLKGGKCPHQPAQSLRSGKEGNPLFSWLGLQVTELKGLASHILVGSVICETKELFTAMPQVVAVDVNDLGTIKLNLEVTWQ